MFVKWEKCIKCIAAEGENSVTSITGRLKCPCAIPFTFFHTFISSCTYIYQILKLADIQKSHVHQKWPISLYFAICTDIACFIIWHAGLFQQALQKVVKTAGKIIGTSLPEISTIYTTLRLHRAHNILRYQHRPAHHLFHLLPSGRRYRLICAWTTRLAHSLYPQAVRLLNEHFWSRATPAWRGSKRYLVPIWFRCYMAMTIKFWILNLLTYVTIFILRFSRWGALVTWLPQHCQKCQACTCTVWSGEMYHSISSCLPL